MRGLFQRLGQIYLDRRPSSGAALLVLESMAGEVCPRPGESGRVVRRAEQGVPAGVGERTDRESSPEPVDPANRAEERL